MIEQRVEDIKKQTQELIEQAYQRGYKKAEEDYHIQSEKDRNSSYQCGYEYGIEQGRNEAWEAAHKLSNLNFDDVQDILSTTYTMVDSRENIFSWCSATEAIEKLNAWEQRQHKDDEIHIGDEIFNRWGTRGIVIEIAPQCNGTTIYSVLWHSAERKCLDKSDWEDYQVWKKTGRTFPEIVHVLAKLGIGADV